MGKRKFDESDDAAAARAGARKRFRTESFDEAVSQSRKKLHRALKLAKGFERQKLSRRQKTAHKTSDPEDLGRIQLEIEAWKTLDAGQVAHAYLSRLIARDKALSQVDALVESASVPQRPAKDQATINVTARLYNANPVKTAVKEIMSYLQACSEIAPRPNVKGKVSKTDGKKSASHRSSVSSEPVSAKAEPKVSSEAVNDKSAKISQSSDDESEHASDSEGDTDVAALEKQFHARLAPDSDGADSMSGSREPENALARTDDEWSGSESEDALSPEANDDEARVSTSREQGSQMQPSESLSRSDHTDSALLPSLTNVGYLSASDSDGSDAESVSDAPRKRNRRGQRARQQIWEQKFGWQAKHLQKPKQGKGKRGRDDGWDLKRGARGPKDDRERLARQQKPERETAPFQARRNNGPSNTKRTRDDTGTLHPSWEAKKHSKSSTEVKPYEGQKIVFD
ncbi:MAG: hypothetical protein Q9162_000537 [Coniocarpon cinnabarinum]